MNDERYNHKKRVLSRVKLAARCVTAAAYVQVLHEFHLLNLSCKRTGIWNTSKNRDTAARRLFHWQRMYHRSFRPLSSSHRMAQVLQQISQVLCHRFFGFKELIC